jgi:hypothetical protein
MHRFAFAPIACAGLLASLTFGLSAQSPADLSGRWTLPADAPLSPAGKPMPAPGFGPEITIVHAPGRVTISRLMGGRTVHVTHPLDGTESRSVTPGRLCEGDAQSIWTAAIEDGAVVTTLVGSLPAGASAPTKMNVRTAFRLQGPDTLSVELTFQNPGMKEPQTRTTTYKKAGPASAAADATAAAPVQARITQLDWLGATWIGTTGTSTFEERWTPPSGGSMLATARSIRNGVMGSFEFLCIAERNGGLVYQAMPNGRQPATDFTLTKLEGTSATFENPTHDFPKSIRYTLASDGTLEAVISGDTNQKPQTFRFKKQ